MRWIDRNLKTDAKCRNTNKYLVEYLKEDEEKSCYPSTVLYWSNTKVPKSIVTLGEIIGNDNDDMMEEESQDNNFFLTVMKTTCKQSLPNFRDGRGDNLWSQGMSLYECIEGQHPALADGLDMDSIFNCIRETNFYQKFIESDVYKKFYKDDPEFEPVREFLEKAFERDAWRRDKNYQFLSYYGSFKENLNPSGLKEDLAKYFECFE